MIVCNRRSYLPSKKLKRNPHFKEKYCKFNDYRVELLHQNHVVSILAEDVVLGLKNKSGSPQQLYVTWQPDSCSGSYELIARDQCGDIVAQQSAAQNTSHFFTGLNSSSNLMVYIRPLYGDQWGPEMSVPQTASTS